MASEAWYHVSGDARVGPVEEAEILRLIDSGQIVGSTLVWRAGMDGWEEASAHFPVAAMAVPPAVPGPRTPPAGQGRAEADSGRGAAPPREFFEAIRVCIDKYVVFSGRASRSEFWYFQLALLLAGLVTGILDTALFGASVQVSPINTMLSIAALLPSLSVSVRRLHDTDRSGWWIGAFYLLILGLGVLAGAMGPDRVSTAGGGLVALVPISLLVYVVVMIVFLCQRGEPRPNRFG